MIGKKKWFILVFLFAVAISIRLFSSNPIWVEKYYSNGLYPPISKFLRYIFCWLPFSVGDILYGIVFFWLLYKIVYGIKILYKKKVNAASFKKGLAKGGVIFLSVYIVFNLFWGINYNRKGIAYQLDLNVEKYTIGELRNIDSLLLQKVNESKMNLLKTTASIKTSKEIFDGAVNAYTIIDTTYSFLNYKPVCIQPSLWGWVGNYLGFTGYYNPFTGEAQVNTGVPKFLQPFTTCHEMAHQLGYAKENEANFVGYLAASSSKDIAFNYSVYIDLFIYANRNLAHVDTLSAKKIAHQLLPEVKADLTEWKRFMLNHKNPIEPGIRWMYGKYLQSNGQPSGMLSYDEVTGLLIAYYKKFGRI